MSRSPLEHRGFAVTLLFVVVMMLSPFLYSQPSNLAFETISIDQGMPTSVRCIIQDRIGYLWFGTWNGLYRYDGYSFVPFRYDIDDTSSLAENLVFALYEDKAAVLDSALSPSESVYFYRIQAGNFSATKKMTAMIRPIQIVKRRDQHAEPLP